MFVNLTYFKQRGIQVELERTHAYAINSKKFVTICGCGIHKISLTRNWISIFCQISHWHTKDCKRHTWRNACYDHHWHALGLREITKRTAIKNAFSCYHFTCDNKFVYKWQCKFTNLQEIEQSLQRGWKILKQCLWNNTKTFLWKQPAVKSRSLFQS